MCIRDRNYTLYRIGAAVGAAVSGAIWTQTLYKDLLNRLDDAALAMSAYSEPYSFIITHTWNTPERDAMVQSYRYVQRLETIVALVFTVPLLVFSFFLRDPPLTDKVAQDNIEEGEYINVNHNDPITDWFSSRFERLRGKKEN